MIQVQILLQPLYFVHKRSEKTIFNSVKHPKVALLREWGVSFRKFWRLEHSKGWLCNDSFERSLYSHHFGKKSVFIYCYPRYLKINVQILGLSRQNGVLLVLSHFVILKNPKVKQLPIAVDALSLSGLPEPPHKVLIGKSLICLHRIEPYTGRYKPTVSPALHNIIQVCKIQTIWLV